MAHISFEFFPPKTDEQREQLDKSAQLLKARGPEYVSCTFGAGGSTLTYTPETISGMPEDLRYTGRGVTTIEERELWHMPIVLIVLVGLVCAEWGYRRATGLA